MIEWQPILLSVKLSLATTLVLMAICLPLALARFYRGLKWGMWAETLVSLPLLLPPTVLGFYIMLLLSPQWGPGAWLEQRFGLRLLFSFPGIVIASCIYTFPFMLNPLRNGLQKIPRVLLEASWTLGDNRSQTTRRVVLPLLRDHIITAAVTTFAHTMGEFGVILMVGGSIPGQTRVASIYLFELVETMQYRTAHIYSLVLLAVSAGLLLLVQWVQRPRRRT